MLQCAGLLLISLFCCVGAVSDSVEVLQTADTAVVLDSDTASFSEPAVETTYEQVDTQFVEVVSTGDEKHAVDSDSTHVRKIKLIKRGYNYRKQMNLAIGMMLFIAVMMAASQNWNPK